MIVRFIRSKSGSHYRSKRKQTIDQEYFVCGIVLFDHKLLYLIYDNYERAVSYPATLFEIVDSSLPEEWYHKFHGYEPYSMNAMWGYKDMISSTPHYDILIEDQEENAKKLFLKRKEEINVVIQLSLLEKDDFSKDFIVKVKGREFTKTLDSFYLENDSEYDEYKNDSYPEKLEGYKKVRAVLVQMLKYWLENVNKLENNETCYLPIDFSDQYTGCFKVKRIEEDVIITYGQSLIEGWSIVPSNPGNYSTSVSDFEKDAELKELTVTRSALILSIEEMIRKFSVKDKRN